MPTFPTYRGEMPAVLSPLNPRHYLLLAYWVYFRPTAFKRYLYQADPDIYRNSDSGFKNLWYMISLPYRKYVSPSFPCFCQNPQVKRDGNG